jgi:hypothetical protein
LKCQNKEGEIYSLVIGDIRLEKYLLRLVPSRHQ